MMMNSGNWERSALGYSTVETLLDDVSKQMALSNLSRYSRGSNGQRTGGSMRVAKPNSASNSPRGSITLGRRRTVMADGLYRRRITMIDQNVVASTSTGFISNDGLQIPTMSNRPVSWHPSTQQVPQPTYQQTYPAPTYDFSNQFQYMNLPPTPAVYSGYTSPASNFSPVSMPYGGYEQQQYPFQDTSIPSQPHQNYTSTEPVMVEQQIQGYSMQQADNLDSTMYSHFNWSNFSTNGFENSTAPPTPENFLPIQHPEPAFPSEESIPYHPLSDTESGEEDLIGVGLYDTPEAAKSPSDDPQLDNYRSLMMSQILGTPYRRSEPTGKGLKLEETWNPPASDDENDADEDADEDGEGEDDDEDSNDGVIQNNNSDKSTVIDLHPSQGKQQYECTAWL